MRTVNDKFYTDLVESAIGYAFNGKTGKLGALYYIDIPKQEVFNYFNPNSQAGIYGSGFEIPCEIIDKKGKKLSID